MKYNYLLNFEYKLYFQFDKFPCSTNPLAYLEPPSGYYRNPPSENISNPTTDNISNLPTDNISNLPTDNISDPSE
jgi:hypothetical protein